MSIGRNHITDAKNLRDVEGDYLKAHIEEYESYKRAGSDIQAQAVAEVLRQMGHEVASKRPAPAKEAAVSPEPLERAVEEDAAPKRRGRPSTRKPE